MEKIKTVEVITTFDEKADWKETRAAIQEATNNYSIDTMCQTCIKKQIEIHGEITIPCKGLATLKTSLEAEIGEEISSEFYSEILGAAGSEALRISEEYENSYTWIENNILDPDLFSPRPYQRMINSCTAKMKVLRMGRRCVSKDTYIRGHKKDYTVKHLFHRLKHHKSRPLIETFDEKTGNIVLTDKYVILPNGIQTTYKVKLKNGYSVSMTGNHPIIVFKNKHHHYEEGQDLEVGDLVLTTDNELVPIESITTQREVTYHVSVVHYETFITRGGFIHHNTGKTIAMAIGLLHRLVTRKDYNVLMVAPMVTMIDEVVEQLRKYCSELKVNPITKDTSQPIKIIEFNTGSVFKGVSAGASGSKATRGKKGDLLYMDECFPAGTKIKMADGTSKPIEEVEEGDYVLSFDEKTGKLVSKKVIVTKVTGYKDVYEFKTISGRKVTCTNNHPVYTRKGWKFICEADDIATLNTKTGTYYHESVLDSRYKGYAKVYNLEVEDTHTYIANGFIVHNCDFLSTKDLNSLLAIINDNADVEVWASSTPIGEGNLYKLGTDPMFKEFHFPSFVTDHYKDETDRFNRRNLTPIAYQQEVLANYGASEDSVFQIKFVDQSTYSDEALIEEGSLVDINYVKANRRNYIITMGVDWNRDKVGTRIIVVALDKSTHRYHIIHKDRVATMGWTQIAAVDAIVSANQIYDVDHVYVDDGHGDMQTSALRKIGEQALIQHGVGHPTVRLMDTKAVMFGSALVLVDPVSNEEFRRPTKQYMVEHTALLLGRGNLVLLSEADNDIVVQLKNYVVKSISAKGLKTYTTKNPQIGDHDLDAYMLALHAIHQEYSEYAGNAPVGTVLSLFNNPLQGEVAQDTSEDYAIIGMSSNVVLNTRRSMIESTFRHSRTKNFRQRRRL